ncbi:hypothetical protein [Candidatus Amarobacter glycogenicus]|uniref:hypothetical protein n=1 Tax=Candidatus Amarobacter glycogenicus TaxID=3140699 RepID=UPI002A16A140|nr:hypothetical protein [Dehalococcoidia bacterium]
MPDGGEDHLRYWFCEPAMTALIGVIFSTAYRREVPRDDVHDPADPLRASEHPDDTFGRRGTTGRLSVRPLLEHELEDVADLASIRRARMGLPSISASRRSAISA